MLQLAPGVRQLSGFPRNQINIYLLGDVLVDAGTVAARNRVLRQVKGRELQANLITHAHPDHFGSSRAVRARLGIPIWAGAGDRVAIETGTTAAGEGRGSRFMSKFPMAPACPVDRELKEGDWVAGFTVLEVPGHSPGHIALWRESDRVLLCGDVFFNIRRLSRPPNFVTWKPEVNRQSMKRLADLRPRLVLFGHGAPATYGPGERMPV